MRFFLVLRVALVLIAVIVTALQSASAHAAKRLALVIGNDRYQTLPKLKLAQADATAVADALRKTGFEVILDFDVSRRSFNRRLSDLEARISPGDTVFFFFAGHGVAIGADNVLIPVDMPVPKAGEDSLVREEGMLTDAIVQRITERGAATTLVVLDACRDNPFAQIGTRSIGRSRGLARTEAPRSVFVLYSAGLGQTALDSLSDSENAANSVFTRNLLPLLVKPGLTHVELAKRVQTETDKLAATVGHQQQPAYYDQIVGDFVLNPLAVESPSPVAAPTPTADDMKKLRLAEAAAAWSALETSEDLAAHAVFIETYKDTAFAKLAQERLALLLKKALPPVVVIKPAEPLAPPSDENGPAASDAEPEVQTDTQPPPKVILDTKDATPKRVKQPRKVVAPEIRKTRVKKAATRKVRVKPVVKRAVAAKRRSGANCFTFEGQRVCD